MSVASLLGPLLIDILVLSLKNEAGGRNVFV